MRESLPARHGEIVTARPAPSMSGRTRPTVRIVATTTTTVHAVIARPVLAPLDPPLQTASGEVPTAPLVLIDVTASDGVVGHAYLFCYTPMVLTALTSLVEELGAAVVGTSDAPRAVEADLRARLRLLRPQGLATMAISGIDMACWDVLARRAQLPLVRLLGGDPRPVRAYGSLRSMAPDDVRAEAGRLAELGFGAYKVKVGAAGLARDREVLAELREAVGPDADLAIDYNQTLPVPEAIRRDPGPGRRAPALGRGAHPRRRRRRARPHPDVGVDADPAGRELVGRRRDDGEHHGRRG